MLARCRRGEAEAWDELFDQLYAPVGRFVWQLGHELTPEDAEEICQETFLAAIRHLDSFHGECRLQTWLFRIAANKARDFRERQHAAKRGGGRPPVSLQAEDPDSGLTLDPPAPEAGPDEILLRAEQSALLQDALDRLDASCREIIELRYFGDLSYEELGQTLRLNPKTVSSRLSRCLGRLEQLVRAVFSGEKTPVSPSNPTTT